jgi:hypothetical protein
MRTLLVTLLSAALAFHGRRPVGIDAAGAPPTPSPTVSMAGLPGADLRTVRVRTYSMSGQIRPLLFWVGQDDIGVARITWREGNEGARGYELLVGTDPAKAPRSLNRWGFVAEETGAGHGAVLALMTGSPDTSFAEATGTAGGVDFRAIRNEMWKGGASWQLTRVRTPSAMTVHDVDRALDRIIQETARGRPVQTVLPPDTRPGFLVALASLIERGAGRPLDSARLESMRRERVRYAFGRKTFELRLRESHEHVRDLSGQPTPVVSSSFEIRTVATGERTRFDVTFGTIGALNGVPVAAEWQPRWWLKVKLLLDAGSVNARNAGN